MERTTLGTTGIQVSRYCLGAMMLGAWGNPDHDDCVRIIHAALDGGINFIDTADVYSIGESEEIVGKALKGRRDSVVLATKFVAAMGEGGSGSAASSRRTRSSPAASRRRCCRRVSATAWASSRGARWLAGGSPESTGGGATYRAGGGRPACPTGSTTSCPRTSASSTSSRS